MLVLESEDRNPPFRTFSLKSIYKVKYLGATSINKIGEVRLFSEIGEGGVWNFEKNELYNYYKVWNEILTFSSVGPFFK